MVAVWHAPALALVALLGVAANAASSQARTSSHKNHSAEALYAAASCVQRQQLGANLSACVVGVAPLLWQTLDLSRKPPVLSSNEVRRHSAASTSPAARAVCHLCKDRLTASHQAVLRAGDGRHSACGEYACHGAHGRRQQHAGGTGELRY